jgi:branched-chain amino acid transport system substrate-binding protein
VTKAGLDRDKIRETIRTQTFQTINGATRFEGVQESTKTASFLQIQDGGLQVVWPQGKTTSQWKPKAGW